MEEHDGVGMGMMGRSGEEETHERREDAGEKKYVEKRKLLKVLFSKAQTEIEKDILCTYFAVEGSTSTMPLLSVLSSSVIS